MNYFVQFAQHRGDFTVVFPFSPFFCGYLFIFWIHFCIRNAKQKTHRFFKFWFIGGFRARTNSVGEGLAPPVMNDEIYWTGDCVNQGFCPCPNKILSFVFGRSKPLPYQVFVRFFRSHNTPITINFPLTASKRKGVLYSTPFVYPIGFYGISVNVRIIPRWGFRLPCRGFRRFRWGLLPRL